MNSNLGNVPMAIECFENAGAMVVPRSRFAPVKTTADLLTLRSDAYRVTEDWRVELVGSGRSQPPAINLDSNHYKLVDQLDEKLVGGVPGGVAGGTPGGVLGGIIGSVPSAAPPPPPPPPKKEEKPATPQRIKIGGSVQQAKLVRRPHPVYPPLAKQARIQGTVKLSAIISKYGTIQHLEVISGHPLLVPAALEAVKQWVYQPTLLNGEPVEVQTQIDVNFTLSQ